MSTDVYRGLLVQSRLPWEQQRAQACCLSWEELHTDPATLTPGRGWGGRGGGRWKGGLEEIV